MNKKIILGAIIVSFLMLGMSIISVVGISQADNKKKLEKIDSPLFKIRTKDAINEKHTPLRNRIKNIISNFLENRLFVTNWIELIFKDDDKTMWTQEGKYTCDDQPYTAQPCGC